LISFSFFLPFYSLPRSIVFSPKALKVSPLPPQAFLQLVSSTLELSECYFLIRAYFCGCFLFSILKLYFLLPSLLRFFFLEILFVCVFFCASGFFFLPLVILSFHFPNPNFSFFNPNFKLQFLCSGDLTDLSF